MAQGRLPQALHSQLADKVLVIFSAIRVRCSVHTF